MAQDENHADTNLNQALSDMKRNMDSLPLPSRLQILARQLETALERLKAPDG